MNLMHTLRNVAIAAALVFFGSLLPSAAFMNEVWHLEGYIASGNATSVGTLTRIHGTVKFTHDQIQFTTNIGNFTRQAPLVGGNYSNTRKETYTYYDYSFDPPLKLSQEVLVEKTRATITTVDESTLILNYGNTTYPNTSIRNFFKSYEWIGAVLTRHPVSSRLFSFDEQSVELWLHPDIYEGVIVGLNDTGDTYSSTPYIQTQQSSAQWIIGGSPLGGFFVDWEGDITQLTPSSDLNLLQDNFLDNTREKVREEIIEGEKVEHYRTVDWNDTRFIHLGDGRIFWFDVDTSLGETIYLGEKTGPYIFSSEMECGLLEQKLWFESSFTPQAATMQSESIQASAVPVTNSSTVPRVKMARVKFIRGEAYEIIGGLRRKLNVNDWVSEGSVVKTEPNSFIKLIFIDKSQFNLAPESEMEIPRYGTTDSSVVVLRKGSFRSIYTRDFLRIDDRNKAKGICNTKCSVIGVRGTEFEVSYSEENGIGTTQLQMIEGTVEFTNLLTGVTNLVSNQEQIVAQGPINGSGITGPEITVIGPTLQSLTSGVAAQSMGVTALPASSEPVVFRIRNIGQSELTGVIPEIRGVHAADFSIVKLPDETLSPITGESSLEIVFTPTAPGLRQAVLEIASSDPDESPFLVNLEGSAVSAYAGWSGGASFGADANGDGVGNGLAFLLGAADPNASALALLPKAARSNGNLVLTFSVLNSAYRNGGSLSVEHSGDLGSSDPWAAALVPDTSNTVNGVIFSVTPGSPHNDVTATIPASEAVSGKLFGRLKAVE